MKHACRVVAHVFFRNLVKRLLYDSPWIVAACIESIVGAEMLGKTIRVYERRARRIWVDVVHEFKTILAISKLVLGILRLDLKIIEKLFNLDINIKEAEGEITLVQGIYLVIIRIRPGVDFDVVRAVAAADLF